MSTHENATSLSQSQFIKDEEIGKLGNTIVSKIEEQCHPDSVTITNGLAMIATVGIGMNHHIGVAARLFTALADAKVNLRVIDQGSSEMNIIVGVVEEDLQKSVRAIYDAFETWD